MHYCCVKLCGRNTKTSGVQKDGVSFHRFPGPCHGTRESWIKFVQNNRREETWLPSNYSSICSVHFKENDKYITKTGRVYLKKSAVPCDNKSELEAQPGPSTSQKTTLIRSTRTSLDSNASKERDPLSTAIEQCRFCGEFSKDCVAVSDSMPYLAANKTTLALNDISVQLDFNDRTLPKTVCKDCDAKLQEIADFLRVVKTAQDTLINVAEGREAGETGVEFEVARPESEAETETLVIKTEYDSQNEESGDEKDDKERIVDSVTVSDTIFVKKSVTKKRKSDKVTAKPKKLKAKKCDSELVIVDIKEEVIEEESGQGQSEISDSDVKPSELELATSALVFEMADEGTSGYQGYRSNS